MRYTSRCPLDAPPLRDTPRTRDNHLCILVRLSLRAFSKLSNFSDPVRDDRARLAVEGAEQEPEQKSHAKSQANPAPDGLVAFCLATKA